MGVLTTDERWRSCCYNADGSHTESQLSFGTALPTPTSGGLVTRTCAPVIFVGQAGPTAQCHRRVDVSQCNRATPLTMRVGYRDR